MRGNRREPKPFNPPDPGKVTSHLSRWTPRPPSPWATRGPIFALVGALVVMLLVRHPLASLLPWMALAGVLIHGTTRVRQTRVLERQVGLLGELSMLRQYRMALRRSWLLMPRLQHHPMLHGRAVAAMAHSLDDLGAHESAMSAYDHLLSGMPEQGPATMHIRISRAIAALRSDHLTDADEALRRMRPWAEEYRGTPIAAAVRMAQLIQDVRTHHYADALEFEPTLMDDLRPLGVEAGYGHGLMALCLHHARPETPRQMTEQRDKAGAWWDSANTLLPGEALTNAFPELQALADHRWATADGWGHAEGGSHG